MTQVITDTQTNFNLFNKQQSNINKKNMDVEDYWTSLNSSLLDTVVGKEYDILEALGHGAFGAIYLSQSITSRNYVAVKVLSKHSPGSETLKLQQLEVDIHSSLNHPNVLKLHRSVQDNKFIYMATEFCDLGDLFDYVVRDQEDNDVRDSTFVKTHFLEILQGIEHMHARSIYHRDIKLENILLKSKNANEEEIECKVADFGLATFDRYSDEFDCGTDSYQAPEQFKGDTSIKPDAKFYDSAAADVWSLGVLLLTLMFGRKPWSSATLDDPTFAEYIHDPSILRDIFPGISPSVLRFVQLALAVNPAKRPTVSEMKTQFMELNNLYDDEEVEEPIDIPHIPVAKKDAQQGTYDSGFFSLGDNTSSMPWPNITDKKSEDKLLERSRSTSYNQFCNEPIYNNNEFDPGGTFHHTSTPCEYIKTTNINTTPLVNEHMYCNQEDTDLFVLENEKDSWWV